MTVRDLSRFFLARERATAEPDGNCIGVLTYLYDHPTGDLGKQLTKSQHDHHDLKLATAHVHLDHDFCLETSVLRGPWPACGSFPINSSVAAACAMANCIWFRLRSKKTIIRTANTDIPTNTSPRTTERADSTCNESSS